MVLNASRVCHYCGGYADTVDHMVPLSQGGTSAMANLVSACMPCNAAKRDGELKRGISPTKMANKLANTPAEPIQDASKPRRRVILP